MDPCRVRNIITEEDILAALEDDFDDIHSDNEGEEDNVEREEESGDSCGSDDEDIDPDFAPSLSDIEEEIIENLTRQFDDDFGASRQSSSQSVARQKKSMPHSHTSRKNDNTHQPCTSRNTGVDQPVLKIRIDGDEVMGRDQKTAWRTVPIKHNNAKTPHKNLVNKRVKTLHAAAEAYEPIDCFRAFFTDDILDIILLHTNKKMVQKKNNPDLSYSTQKNKSTYNNPLQKEELEAFLGSIVLSGAVRSNHLPVKKLYDCKISGGKYRAALSINRFEFISSCLEFDEIETREERRQSDRFALVSEMWDILIEQCKKNYEPSSYLTVDERLVGFRGNCPFRMYIPSKPNKYGIKFFLLCDVATRYMVNGIPYLGKGSNPSNTPAGTYFTKRLVQHIAGSCRNITADNWFSSIALADELLQEFSVTFIGTIKKNKPHLPSQLVDIKYKNRPLGSSAFVFKTDMTAVSYVPKKNKIVTLVSTLHDDDVISPRSGKPEIILNYNQTKGAVDAFDQMCERNNCARKTNRWNVCIFYEMMNIACTNAYVIYVHNFFKQLSRTQRTTSTTGQKKTGTTQKKNSEQVTTRSQKKDYTKPLSRLEFLIKLQEQLATPWMKKRLNTPLPNTIRSLIYQCLEMEYPQVIQPTRANEDSQPCKRLYCTFCNYKKQRKSKMKCNFCNRPVCGEHHKNICIECENSKK